MKYKVKFSLRLTNNSFGVNHVNEILKIITFGEILNLCLFCSERCSRAPKTGTALYLYERLNIINQFLSVVPQKRRMFSSTWLLQLFYPPAVSKWQEGLKIANIKSNRETERGVANVIRMWTKLLHGVVTRASSAFVRI